MTIEISGYNPAGGYAMDPPDQPWFEQRYPPPPVAGTPEAQRAYDAQQAMQAAGRYCWHYHGCGCD